MQQLQELHQIFHITDAPPTDLQFRIVFSGRTALKDFLPPLKFLDLFQIEGTLKDEVGHFVEKSLHPLGAIMNRATADMDNPLPGSCDRMKLGARLTDGGHQRPGDSPRSQTQVGAVNGNRSGVTRENTQDSPCRQLAWPRIGVVIAQEVEVDVAGKVELATTPFSKGDHTHRQIFRADHLKRGTYCQVRQLAEGIAGLFDIDPAIQLTANDPQKFATMPAGEGSQSGGFIGPADGGCFDHRVAGICKTGGGHLYKMPLGQIRHRLTGSKDEGQPLEPPFFQKFPGKAVTAGEGSLETIEGCVRICRFCEGCE